MSDEIYEKKKGPVRRAIDKAKTAALWVRNRRSARAVQRAIVSNQLATVALTASVAAAGVGGYANLEARKAQDSADRANAGVAGVQQRLAAVENDVRVANVALAEAQYDVEVLKDQTAQGMRNLRNKLAKMMLRVDDVSRSVASLPAPEKPKDYSPAIQRAQRLADAAAATAQKAQNAAQEAQKNATDPQARQAAAEAQSTAKDASDAARDLQEQIDEIPEPIPGYQPFPRVVAVPDVISTQAAGPWSRGFVIDLPKGNYTVTLNGDVEIGDTTGYFRVVAAGLSEGRIMWGGGNLGFTVQGDSLQNHGGPATWKNITVTFEEVK